ncbi:MAG TPA: 50S ribosomal protein L15 [Thermoanaerobaculia bacterium]|jgi:large subunit ribosomal protein L15|nr:50S ribosomal protein L15 [Thermoanaerobaculia bacterium]
MKLHELKPAVGSREARRRVGRGPGSGLGKTAGRGHNGQKSRAGYSSRPGFEGGQMPLVRRVPKRGFNNIFRVEYAVINVGDLEGFEGVVGPRELESKGKVRKGRPVKVLGGGELTGQLTVQAQKFSAEARRKIEAAGGRCQELD